MPSRNKSYSKIRINVLNFQKKISISQRKLAYIKNIVRETIFSQKQIKSGVINICLCDNKKIKGFNSKYFSKNTPTDVIAFNITDPRQKTGFLADIIISTDTVVSNCDIFKTEPLYELFFCVIHGVLHILGDEDDTEKKMQLMHRKQREICSKIMVVNKAGHQVPMFPSHPVGSLRSGQARTR